MKSAYELLQHMVALASRGELFVKFKSGKLHSTRLDIPIPSSTQIGSEKVALGGVNDHTVSLMVNAHGKSNGIESSNVVLPKGQSNNVPATRILRWSFNDVIHACGQSKNSELAEQLMLQMQNLGLVPSSHTYDGFIRAVAFPGAYEYGMTLVRDLSNVQAISFITSFFIMIFFLIFTQLKVMQQQNLKPYNSTLATVSAYCSKAFQVDLAEHLLDQVSECSFAYPFNNLLAACDSLVSYP